MDYKILIGELREFKKQAMNKLDSLEKRMQSLEYFKVKVMSISGLAAFIATIVIEWMRK